MADQDNRNQNANKTDDAGGITNRPLSDEIENQESLPERGTKKDQTRDPGARVREGDYEDPALPADDATLNTKI